MRHSPELKRRVAMALACERWVDAASIAVAVDDGVATLTGTVSSYGQKVTTERVVKRIAGINAVANRLEVVLPYHPNRTGEEIAVAVAEGLERAIMLPEHSVQVRVADGWVTCRSRSPAHAVSVG